MTFINSSKGLNKVFSASILELLAVVATSVIISITMGMAFKIVALVICLVLALAALILNVQGLQLAAKDDRRFVTAYEITIAAIILEIFYMLCPIIGKWVPFFNTLAKSSVVMQIVSIIADVFVVSGVISLFDRKGNLKSASYARCVTVIMIISGVADVVIGFFSVYYQTSGEKYPALFVWLGVAYIVFTIVAYVMYLVLLRKAVNKLA